MKRRKMSEKMQTATPNVCVGCTCPVGWRSTCGDKDHSTTDSNAHVGGLVFQSSAVDSNRSAGLEDRSGWISCADEVSFETKDTFQ